MFIQTARVAFEQLDAYTQGKSRTVTVLGVVEDGFDTSALVEVLYTWAVVPRAAIVIITNASDIVKESLRWKDDPVLRYPTTPACSQRRPRRSLRQTFRTRVSCVLSCLPLQRRHCRVVGGVVRRRRRRGAATARHGAHHGRGVVGDVAGCRVDRRPHR